MIVYYNITITICSQFTVIFSLLWVYLKVMNELNKTEGKAKITQSLFVVINT